MRKCSCHASKDLSCWLTEYYKKKQKKTTKNNLLCRTDTKPRRYSFTKYNYIENP